MNHTKTFLTAIFIGVLFTVSGFQTSPEYKILFEKAKFTMETKGDLDGAITLFNDIIKKYPKEREYAAKSQLYIGLCYEKLGVSEARKAYERVVKEYSDQSDIVNQAKGRLAALGTPGETKGFVTRRILIDAIDVGGALTADGKYFRSLNLGKGDIYQFEIASGQKSQIQNKGQWNETDKESIFQALSRDGNQIAYDSYNNTKDWIPQLMIRNLDGSEIRILHCEKDFYFYPFDWSPDSKFILGLLSKNETNALTLISTTDSSVHILRNIPSGLFIFDKACFSPNGKYIAFSYIRDGNPPHGDIFLISSDGRDETIVAGHPSEDRLIGWTPDGKNLLFRSDRSGTWDIWTARITNGKQQGEPEMIKKDFGYYSSVLGIAPNGSVYYRTETPSGGLYKGEIDIETGKVLTTPAKITTRYIGAPFDLSWSPDGKFLLYLSRRGGIAPGSNILTIRSDATGEERFLSPDLRFVNQISWAPDGRSILAIGITEKESAIFRIDTETSRIAKLADQSRFIPKLCPDGKTLVFLKGGVMTISKLNLETGEESEVTKAAWAYDISPDGQSVVFNQNNIVKTIPLSGGEPKEISDSLALYYRLKWTSDGRNIIVRASGNDNNENSKIYRIPAQGGFPLKLDISVPNMVSFALHPDNKHFVYSTREESKSELWVMENFLPK